MSRYYYTDPLDAAWMAKHFGMRLELILFDVNSKREERRSMEGDILDWPRLNLDTERFGLRYSIHPDSLSLLEPQEGDLIDGVRIGYVQEIYGRTLNVDVHGGDWEMDIDRVTIIQRNGIPFHWPKEELENVTL